jgi:predicted  nucleic acid-binding Zn-ribbon protein
LWRAICLKLRLNSLSWKKKHATLGKEHATLHGNYIEWQKKFGDLQKMHQDLQKENKRFEETLMAERDQWRRGKEELLKKEGAWWEEKVELKKELEECECGKEGLQRTNRMLDKKVAEIKNETDKEDTALKELQAEVERSRASLKPETRANKRIRTEE